MERGISSLVFILLMIGLAYYGWIGFTPYYFHDMIPNVPMQTVIGGKAWYFPMGYIDPHYPQSDGSDGGYSRGGETEVWLSMDTGDYRIIPQDVAKQTLSLGPAIDVVLTSDQSPKVKKALAEFKALKAQTDFMPGPYGLTTKIIGDETEYLTRDTRISCGKVNCTLFTVRIPDVRVVMVFNKQVLPAWDGVLVTLATELQPFRQKPPMGDIIKDFVVSQPVGAQRAATDPNGELLPPGSVIPETRVPTANTK